MPVQGNIVIKDGATTPADVTFTTAGVKYDATSDTITGMWKDNSVGVPVGRRGLVARYKRLGSQLNSNTVVEEQFDIEVPVLEVLGGQTAEGYQAAPRVGFILRGQVRLLLPARASLQNRKDLLAFTKNFLATSLVTAGVESLDPVS